MAPEVPARPIGATAGAEAGGQAEATPSPTMVFFRGDQLRTVAQYRTTVRTAKAQKAAGSHSSALARAFLLTVELPRCARLRSRRTGSAPKLARARQDKAGAQGASKLSRCFRGIWGPSIDVAGWEGPGGVADGGGRLDDLQRVVAAEDL